jgi:dimethylamine/trimethylamine dehydrogenase
MGRHERAQLVAMRAVKAERGWGVVCTEEVDIHPCGDVSPYAEGRLCDDADLPGHEALCDAVAS